MAFTGAIIQTPGRPTFGTRPKVSCGHNNHETPNPIVDTFESSGYTLTNAQRRRSRRLARQLTRAAGSGDQKDVDVAVQALSDIPPKTLKFLKQNKVKILIGRGNVTDVRPELKGQRPRNWAEGMTFEDVPGIYFPEQNAVILTTEGHNSPGGPRLGSNNGSSALAVHEVFHAVERHRSRDLKAGSEFQQAYGSAYQELPRYERERAGGDSEAYAESAARYLSGTPQPAALNEYWSDNMPRPQNRLLMKLALVGGAVTQPTNVGMFLASRTF